MDPLGLKIIFATCLVFVPLERLFALHPEQKIFRRAFGNDLIFLFLNGLVSKFGLLAVLAAVILAASRVVPPDIQAWIAALPYWVQIPAIILLTDLGCYWTHRMFHVVPWLWKFHSIHHSIEELDWLAASRVHPVDQIVTRGVSLAPVFALGFSEWAIGASVLLFHWQSVFVHSNLRIGFGALRLLFASPEFHHWHHSSDLEVRDRNFAAQLPFLDAAFGTLHMPAGQMPSAYGLDRPMPQRYARQLMLPFVGDGVRRSVTAATTAAEEMPAINLAAGPAGVVPSAPRPRLTNH
jgi:sterol desaturase/sphingolipid hydroxylase (fatty acid hydroxylase superfamily)